MHNVSQWPNLRHLAEPLGGAVGLLEAVSLKETTAAEVELRMLAGSEFQTVGTAMLMYDRPIQRNTDADFCLSIILWSNTV